MELAQTSFDFEAAERAKAIGMYEAAESKKGLLEYARKLAVKIAEREGTVDADKVQMALECEGISVFALGSAAGSLFRTKQFEWTGEFMKSAREHSHNNLLRIWKLK